MSLYEIEQTLIVHEGYPIGITVFSLSPDWIKEIFTRNTGMLAPYWDKW